MNDIPTRAEIDSSVDKLKSVDKKMNVVSQAVTGTMGAIGGAFVFSAGYMTKHAKSATAAAEAVAHTINGKFRNTFKAPVTLFKNMGGGGKAAMGATMAGTAILATMWQRHMNHKVDKKFDPEIEGAIQEAYAAADAAHGAPSGKSFVGALEQEKVQAAEQSSQMSR